MLFTQRDGNWEIGEGEGERQILQIEREGECGIKRGASGKVGELGGVCFLT